MKGKVFKEELISAYFASKCVIKTIIKGKRTRVIERPSKDILILGNGPSLNEIDLERFSGKVDFCCLNFYPCMSDLFFKIKPKYYCMTEPAVFEGEDKPLINDKVKRLKDSLKRVDWPIKVITRQGYSFGVVNTYLSYERLSLSVFDRDSKWASFLFDHNLAVPGYANVLCTAILYFVMSEARCIVLSGADFSLLFGTYVDERNHCMYHLEHFYEEEDMDLTENGMVGEDGFTYWMEQHTSAFTELYKIKKYAEKKGIKIINTSLRSYIDMFEKIKWDNVLKQYE